ncbi:MAG: hypothetical protein ACKPKO_12965, partial [Candidatus Fonsibacter sp.]
MASADQEAEEQYSMEQVEVGATNPASVAASSTAAGRPETAGSSTQVGGTALKLSPYPNARKAMTSSTGRSRTPLEERNFGLF